MSETVLTLQDLKTRLDAVWYPFKAKRDAVMCLTDRLRKECDAKVKKLMDDFFEETDAENDLIDRLDLAISLVEINGEDPLYAYLRSE